MQKVLELLSKNLILAIPLTMLFGFLAGVLVPGDGMRVLILPLTFLMVYPMMVSMRFATLREAGDGKVQGLAQFINFAIIPFVAFLLGRLFFPEHPYYAIGLLLAALLPTSGMTISWTGFAGGNLGAAIKMTVVGLILGSLATPLYVKWLMGATISVDVLTVFLHIGLIVFLPMAAGYGTQVWLVRRFGRQTFQSEWAPRFPPLSTLGVLGVVFVAMALKAEQLLENPAVLLYLVVPLLILYGLNYLLSSIVAKMLLPRADGIALVYGTVMRNLSIALALAMNAFGPAGSDAALVITVAYIIQVQSAAGYVRLTDHVFGKATQAA